MRKVLLVIILVGMFNSQTYAQSVISDYYHIEPNPAYEGQIVRIGFLTGCRIWEDHSFEVNDFVIDYEVTYYDCLVGVPTPEFYDYNDLGFLPAGDYQVNMTVAYATSSPAIIIEDSFAFGVLPLQQVPFNSALIYFLLGSLLVLVGSLYYRYYFNQNS